MRAFFCIFLSYCFFPQHAQAQHADTIPTRLFDSAWWHFLSMQQQGMPDILLLNESSREEEEHIASPLHAERDPFLKLSMFQFGIMRFRLRGYDAAYSTTLINGINMNDPVSGAPGWQLWSGLQPVMKNTSLYIGHQFSSAWPGSLATTEETDMRAHVQRPRIQLGYAHTNRNFQHRFSLIYATGIRPNGWSVAMQVLSRWASVNAISGSTYHVSNYYLAISKVLKRKRFLSFTGLGTWQQMGRQAAVTLPAIALFGRGYNPNWGIQGGQARNAVVLSQHRPVMIFSYQKELPRQAQFFFSLGMVKGKRSDTRLDWSNAADPRPDYYRYLPAFQSDSTLQAEVKEQYLADPMLGQINWPLLYEINRNAYSVVHDANGIKGNTIAGKAAHYLLEERVDDLFRVMLSAAFYQPIGQYGHLSVGGQYRYQRNHYYKLVKDLLGADYHVNWNQFAETAGTLNSDAIQFDLAVPNRIVLQGQRYGHDHAIVTKVSDLWGNFQQQLRKTEINFSLHFAKMEIFRKGYARNGLFPLSSYGKGTVLHFVNLDPVLSYTYKFNGRNYLRSIIQLRGRPPAVNDIYLSPRTRHSFQDNLRNETVRSIEISYLLHLPYLRGRITAFSTTMQHGMRVMSFYHDAYRSFVNYAITGIDRTYHGLETGIDWQPAEHWRILVAASLGTYTYRSRQQVTVTLDNDDWLLEKTEVYSKGFNIPGTPQTVVGAGIQYTRNSLFINLNWNYFRNRWLDINPYRRTYGALETVVPGSDHWRAIVDQFELPPAALANLFLGKGFNLKRGGKRWISLFWTLGVNNLLNKQEIISGGYEQLRFDAETKDVNKFPPKLFWLQGRNYSTTLSINL